MRLLHAQRAVMPADESDAALELSDYEAVYRHYGCTPFWDAASTGTCCRRTAETSTQAEELEVWAVLALISVEAVALRRL